MRSRDQSPPIRTQWLISAALDLGISQPELKEFLVSVGVEKTDWSSLPTNSYIALLNYIASVCKDYYLGIHLARKVDLSSFGGGAYMIYHAANFRDCCECLASYDMTISQGISINFVKGARTSRLEYQINQDFEVDLRQDTEMSMGMLVHFARQQLGYQWTPKKVQFRHSAPPSLEHHQPLFGDNILFDQAVTSVSIDNATLNTPVTTADPYLLEILRNHTDELQDKLLRKDNPLIRVRYFIARTIGTSNCTAEDASIHLNMSRRTLTRHLKQHETTFRDLKNSALKEMSVKALIESNASVSEIALSLGYSETSAFDRAFKILTGLSPTSYRRKHFK